MKSARRSSEIRLCHLSCRPNSRHISELWGFEITLIITSHHADFHENYAHVNLVISTRSHTERKDTCMQTDMQPNVYSKRDVGKEDPHMRTDGEHECLPTSDFLQHSESPMKSETPREVSAHTNMERGAFHLGDESSCNESFNPDTPSRDIAYLLTSAKVACAKGTYSRFFRSVSHEASELENKFNEMQKMAGSKQGKH